MQLIKIFYPMVVGLSVAISATRAATKFPEGPYQYFFLTLAVAGFGYFIRSYIRFLTPDNDNRRSS